MTPRTLFLAVVVFGVWRATREARLAVARRLPVGASRAARSVDPVAVVRRVVGRFGRARTWRRFDERLPDTVAAVARGLRSGASLFGAVAEAAAAAPSPVAAPLRQVVAAVEAGMPLGDALDEWGRRCPRPNVLLLTAALSLAHETGGASAQAVDGVAATLRRRNAARAEAVALATQARVSAYVLAGAPLVVCLFAVVTGAAAARFLLGTPIGLACLGLGLGLEALGCWWMAHLARPAELRRSVR